MSQQKPQTFSISKFMNQVRDPDTDFTIIAFNDLISFLNDLPKNQEFDLPLETIKQDFLPNVISRLADKVPDIVNPIFRIIVLLSEKLPIASLSSFFEQIFIFVNDPECQIRNQILSVLREVLANSRSFSTERQQTIVDFFINKLNENSNVEILIFNIDIMASLLESLGSLFDESNLKHSKELILAHIEDQKLDVIPSVASLARIWMFVAVVNGMSEQFNAMMDQLYKIGERNSNAYTILSSMVCYRPSIYKDEAVNLLSLFYQIIQDEEVELGKKIDEDPEIDIYYDTPYVQHMTDYISSLTALIKTFPKKFSDEQIDNCISTAFTYLTYGIAATTDEAADNNGNEEDEDDFVIEGGEPGEVIELDEADDDVVTGDDSWKIRKTAIALAIALIQCYPEKFFESLGFRDEETDCLSVVNTLIRDSDSGSQNDAFDFLKIVIHYYKDNLQEEDVYQWFSTLQNLFTSKNNQSIAATIIETITYVLKEYQLIPDDLLVKIITSIQPLVNNNTIQSLLAFLLAIFSVIQPATNVLSSIAVILRDVINNTTISSTVPYIHTISKLYEYAGPIESSIQEDQECVEKLRELALSIISLCSENEKADKNVQAFETLGVILASFNEDIFKLCDQCISILVETLESDSPNTPLKNIYRSICLIAESENGKLKLESYADQINSNVCQLLSQDYTSIDSAVLFICLWTLRILLEKEIIDPLSSQCQSVTSYLAKVFSTSDSRNILLSTSIFMQIPASALNSLADIKSSLEGQVLDEQIVKSYAKLIWLCGTQDIKSTEEFLISLIDKEYEKAEQGQLNDVTPNVAYVIGYVAGNFKEICDKLLQDFENKLNVEKDTVLQFVLQCVGEIGSHVDLSDRSNIIDSVFRLIHSQNREVFNAAAECVGLLSIGSTDKILKRTLVESMKEKDNSVWILAILSMMKHLPLAEDEKFVIPYDELEKILEFLIENADYDKPTEKSIAESLSCMIKIDPSNYIDRLIEYSHKRNKYSPVTAHSIALYFEGIASSDDPYYCFNFIDKIMSSVDLNDIIVSEFYIICLKVCLQIMQQNQNASSDTSKLNSKELLEKVDLFNYYDLVCEATKFIKEKHIITINLGINSVEKDIGFNLRLNAVNCLILMLSIYNERIDVNNLFDLAFNVIVIDIKDEIQNQALVLLTKMALDKNIADQLYDIITNKKDVFPKLEDIIFPLTKQKVDSLEDNYFRLIVALRNTECRKIKEIEQIYVKHKDEPKISKFESDLSYSVNTSSPYAAILSSGSAGASLMKKFYPEATTIFLI